MMRVLDEAGEWMLCWFDDGRGLAATKPIPYEGARYYSTEDRSVRPGKTSEYGLSTREVLERYRRLSERATSRGRLRGLVEAES